MTERLAVLTGAASGIGRAAAIRLAAEGWRCLIVDRDAGGLNEVVAALPGGAERHRGVAADLTDPAAFAAVAEAVAGMGPVEALINNAGMSDGSGTPLAAQEAAQPDRLMALNLHAPARMVAALRTAFAPGARVVNVASGAGLRAIPFRGAYSPSKAGLIAQSAALAAEMPDLTVTTLCPGFVRTELVDGLIAAGRLDPAQAAAKTPMGRMAAPAEMAEALVFLASPDARPLSGTAFSLDGGSSVYGGSMRYEAEKAAEPLALTVSTQFTLRGCAGFGGLDALLPDAPADYEAAVDGTALDAAPGGLFAAVHAAAGAFASQGDRRASLTLLLPAAGEEDWRAAGDRAAAHMAVATLACEWGLSGLRINALELSPGFASAPLAALLTYVGGARAQYLTGQILQTRGED